MTRSKTKGFTLIELLIVVGIIAVLVAVLAIAIMPWLGRAKPRATRALLKNIGDAIAGEKILPNEVQFKKDAGTALTASVSTDQYKRSGQMLVFYLCPSKDVWDKAPNYKGKGYNPKQDPQQFKESLREDGGAMAYFVDAWENPLWYKVDQSGRFYVMSAGEDAKWGGDDDLIFDSNNSSVKTMAEIKGK